MIPHLTTTEVADLVTEFRKRPYSRQAVTMAILDKRLAAASKGGIWLILRSDAVAFAKSMALREKVRRSRERAKALAKKAAK